ncbi:alpha/beta fold hydrolase [Nitratireductor pacificus]|uniref:Alpha/beta hydrolase Fold protein n=1 Tax=Nitratireductor pacificus pht-3B TaxID=391937 RepID=K2N3F3_9HYPH|nr:alpha/beta hydrolase [Nitratireductor pacificus]EKF18783.1 alpha/beta hydrolase Fold protein [Nitratireductor pacificus pht-3B]
MLKFMLCAILAAAVITTATPDAARAESTSPAMQSDSRATKTGRQSVNGVDYYYEIHGEGEPLLLLHGGLGSIDMYAPILPMLVKSRTVIAVDLHGHGRTQLGDRSIDMADIGADMAVLVDALGYDQVDVLGYSFGAWTGLHMAAQAPERVRRLVLISMPYSREGFFPEMLPQQAQLSGAAAEAMKDTPMYQSYLAVAPEPGEFPKLLDEVGELLRSPYDYSAAVKKLTMPVMLVYGDSDMIRPEHIVSFYQMLGGGLKDAGWQREYMAGNRLAILPDLTHYETFMAPEVYRAALPFLDGKSGMKSWAEAVKGE